MHARYCHDCGLSGPQFLARRAKDGTGVRYDDLLWYLEDSEKSGGYVRYVGEGGMATYRYGQICLPIFTPSICIKTPFLNKKNCDSLKSKSTYPFPDGVQLLG